MATRSSPAAKASHAAIPLSAPIAVLHGPEQFLVAQHTRDLRDALTRQHTEIDVFAFDGNSVSPAEVLDECRSMGLMMRPKLVIVDNAERFLSESDDDEAASSPKAAGPRSRVGASRSARELMESYAKQPETTAVLLLRANVWRPGNLDKAIVASGGVVIKCEKISLDAAHDWATARAPKALGVTLAPDAADLLIEELGNDLARISSELEKLAIAARARVNAGETPVIAADLVQLLVGASRQDDAWSMQSELLSGSIPRAMDALRSRLDVSRMSPVLLGVAYIDLARKLSRASIAASLGKRDNEIAGEAGLWAAAAAPIISAAKRLPPAAAAALLREAIRADERQKTGDGDPEHILEGLTVTFVHALAPRHGAATASR
ncbi:MAG: DNA polymerase III subunit delta [Phycisphaerales bacterium]|nr:DNA polymerase III subunit delta [Phycisphaerales bacterium]